jgi:hypothetical protein
MAEFEKKKEITENPAEPIDYRWEPTDKFILTGIEFDLIYRGLRANLKDSAFVRVATIVKALEVADGVFKQGVDAGVIRPVYPEAEPRPKGWQDLEISPID